MSCALHWNRWLACLRFSKVKLRCILAALSRRNPGMAIRMIFDRTECPFDLKHPSIDPVADYLKKFALEVVLDGGIKVPGRPIVLKTP